MTEEWKDGKEKEEGGMSCSTYHIRSRRGEHYTRPARGDLVEPFGHRIAVSGAYYVVHPRRARLRPAAGYLKEWLLDEAGKTGIS